MDCKFKNVLLIQILQKIVIAEKLSRIDLLISPLDVEGTRDDLESDDRAWSQYIIWFYVSITLLYRATIYNCFNIEHSS